MNRRNCISRHGNCNRPASNFRKTRHSRQSHIVGYNTVAVEKSKFIALGVQFTDVNGTTTSIAIKDLLKVDTPYGMTALNGAADQIHVWTGMAWDKYFYHMNLKTWVKSGESTETTDSVNLGDTVFFLRSMRGNGNITLSGGVYVSNTPSTCSLTKSKFHFLTYPWPVEIKIDDIKNCIDVPYGMTSLNGAADQIHVWTGMAWDKYFYHSNLKGFVKSGENAITTDVIEPGEGFFFLRSMRGNGTLTFTKPVGL